MSAMVFSPQQIKFEFLSYIKEFGGRPEEWRVGCAVDAQKAMFEQGIPLTSFESSDVVAEAKRLKDAGVVFTKEPTRMGPVMMAIFSDTCGNLIQIHQPV